MSPLTSGLRNPPMRTRRGVFLAAIALGFATSCPAARAQSRAGTVTPAPVTGFRDPIVEVLLYNPPLDEVTWKYPYKRAPSIQTLKPSLTFRGKGMADGTYTVSYRIEAGERPLFSGTAEVPVTRGLLEKEISLTRKYPEATRVSYEFAAEKRTAIRGHASLGWSRFHGQVKYLDGGWRSASIRMFPHAFNSRVTLVVPVMEDGRFDALVPSRIYPVINVDSSGYGYDALERWAWDYDLTRDREDVFTIGRTELYGIHAFNIIGGPRTVFVIFRPTALSRVLRFDSDGDGLTSGEERNRIGEAMKKSPTVIGPELTPGDVTVWLDGEQQKIAQFIKIPEYDGNLWQVQYLLQIYPDASPAYAVWHEIKLEVRSKETLRGREIVDFGQGSVGFYRQ